MYEEQWWNPEIKDEELAHSLVGHFKSLDENQSSRREANLRNLRLYSSLALLGLSSTDSASQELLPLNRLKMNVTQSVIDTAQALISTNRTRVQYSTFDGDYKMQQKAKNLTYLTDGQF